MSRIVPVAALLLLGACSTTAPKGRIGASTLPSQPERRAPAPERGEVGLASYYATSLEGRKTASGERYLRSGQTCAHRSHRFGTWLQVTSLTSGKSVRCRVNDRGPFVKGRIVDLSRSLAEEMGIVERGLDEVRVEVR